MNLRKSVQFINDALGSLSFVYTICAMPFYCAIFANFFESHGPFNRMRVIFYMIYFTFSLILAAEGHKMVMVLF